MKNHLRFVLPFVAFFVGVGTAGATESVRVQSSRNLRVAVIDASKAGATRASVHESFAAAMASAVQQQGGKALPVKLTELTNGAKAAAGLAAGSYDALLIFENSLPATFASSELMSSRGFSELGAPVRVFHLVLRRDDTALASALTAAFGETVKTRRFQDALARSTAVRAVAANTL